ncbi:hypothetical protein M408DRAFT_26383 [Serendipita vermifera MAFF 305830]|uniref:Uncharacterized protein n=1 Tax=Serendipita vermifera MAFF 305830 TaxID=933852 RepID=A0A0C3AKT7_SERVB|nr:hypothetical protein M408DRAFT_26383 [Serendipita vermifera MAFF 305830]
MSSSQTQVALSATTGEHANRWSESVVKVDLQLPRRKEELIHILNAAVILLIYRKGRNLIRPAHGHFTRARKSNLCSL